MKKTEMCENCLSIREFGKFRGRVRQAIWEKGLYLNLAESDETIIQELRKKLGLKPKEKKVTKKDLLNYLLHPRRIQNFYRKKVN